MHPHILIIFSDTVAGQSYTNASNFSGEAVIILMYVEYIQDKW